MDDNVDTIIAKYGQKAPKKPRIGRVVLVSLLILLLVAGIVVSALYFLKDKPADSTKDTPAQTSFNGPTPKDIVDTIAADPTVAGAKNYFLFRTTIAQSDPNSDTSAVVYEQDGYDFVTNTTAEDGIRFTLTDAKVASSKAAITEAITAVLKKNGFTQTTGNTSTLSAYVTTSFYNNGTVCQILDYAGEKQSILEQGVICASHEAMQAAYKNAQTLLTKADSSVIAKTKTVTQTVVTDGTKKLLTLTTQPRDASDTTKYYFATLDTDYEYIGNRPSPSVDNQASFTLSDQLKKNIADPKWGTFLADNIK